ncbi:MAG: flagellar hook-associated protein FlgL [Senegalia sp. (in: firmicutes)]|uniref:flagellar hook-associated protein FlgL n=1 Tax=Senegalia sp. (in: firmicutes) TaxID=1924098 RepID=UPI003F9742A0
MRITNNMMISNMMRNVNNNLETLSKTNDKMTSGKKFQLPSDDPIGVSKSLKFHTDLSRIEQYKRNVDDANSWMEITESSVSQIGDVLQRARELTVQGANGTNTAEDKEKISAEIKQLREQVIKVANTKYAGRGIFSGYKTGSDLIGEDGKYNIDLAINEKTEYNVGSADTIDVNIVGTRLFGAANGSYDAELVSAGEKPEMIAVFDRLIDGLDTDDSESINESLGEVDDTISNLLSVRAEIGAKTNRLELNMNRLEDQTLSVTKLLSKNEDADIAKTIIDLKTQETVYQASLQAGARIIQPSLMDFLR